MIIVTPRIAQLVSDISEFASSLGHISVPRDMESFIGGTLEGPVADSGGLPGSYDYTIE